MACSNREALQIARLPSKWSDLAMCNSRNLMKRARSHSECQISEVALKMLIRQSTSEKKKSGGSNFKRSTMRWSLKTQCSLVTSIKICRTISLIARPISVRTPSTAQVKTQVRMTPRMHRSACHGKSERSAGCAMLEVAIVLQNLWLRQALPSKLNRY